MAIWIGIDPGDHTGVAVWDAGSKRFIALLTLPLHRAFDVVKGTAASNPQRTFVVFEDARQRKWFRKERSASEYRGRLMGAGAAKRDAKIWEEFLADISVPYAAHKPQAGTTKWSAEHFAKVTGWKGRCSEHARDAALLVYGR